jgi:hypothetical protein
VVNWPPAPAAATLFRFRHGPDAGPAGPFEAPQRSNRTYRHNHMKFTTILSLSLILPVLPAQEAKQEPKQEPKKECCAEGQAKAEGCCATDAKAAPDLAKEFAALTAKVKALAAKDKAELQAAAKLVGDTCPISQSGFQVLTVLHQAATAYKANPECCPATPHEAGHGGEDVKAPAVADHERLANVGKVLDAQWALLAELGVKPVKPSCCGEGDKADCCADGKEAKGDAKKDAKDEKKADCCASDNTAKFIACASVTTTAVKACTEKAAKIEKAQLEKVHAAAAQLEKLGIGKAMQQALAFYDGELKTVAASMEKCVARGAKAAEGGCPEGDEMKAKAETMAKVIKGLAEMTSTYHGIASKCCETGAAPCCEDPKAKK